MYKAGKEKWAQKANERMERKGTKGSLARAAHKAGYDSPLAYARHIKSHKGRYSAAMRKKANFAANINQ